ncbi:SMI1/KNR4 family protein [Chitinophaga sp. Ak27]|uniref:SMI1/KNR4 family protein n=1 Tax=Chitinophaga sp. Ak27 TaxID=2726116 RepID=UPI00145DB15F|nr:SMI1/KNR4 family protein [Chitinophaga sp. Ak27]NLU96022.1 SMI1/KNR4 family protein [Chitinophaga sp. Ak27]
MANNTIIKEIIDFYLKTSTDEGANKFPSEIEPEMADHNQDPSEEWRNWFPIDSTVTDSDIKSLENQIGYHLPEDYKTFLKHKHYYELYISEASFCRHPINKWAKHLHEMIFEGWPTEEIIDRGFIPFADWSDWGLLCFDANRNLGNNDYPIVLWDHDRSDEIKDVADNFMELLIKLDKENKQMWLNNEKVP